MFNKIVGRYMSSTQAFYCFVSALFGCLAYKRSRFWRMFSTRIPNNRLSSSNLLHFSRFFTAKYFFPRFTFSFIGFLGRPLLFKFLRSFSAMYLFVCPTPQSPSRGVCKGNPSLFKLSRIDESKSWIYPLTGHSEPSINHFKLKYPACNSHKNFMSYIMLPCRK